MIVDPKSCTGCGLCAEACPLEAIGLVEAEEGKRAEVDGAVCVDCGACSKVCPQGALRQEERPPEPGRVRCDACPIGCQIPEGGTGACRRFIAEGGSLRRVIPLHTFEDVRGVVGPDYDEAIRRPLITGIGAGTTYPDPRPAPWIVKGEVQGVEVVTVVTEAPLSYSSLLVKIDTDRPIGEEGAPVLYKGKRVGHLTTEQYGSKMLSLGGVNLLTGPDGIWAAKVMTQLANRQPISLRVKGGSRLELQVGEAPMVDGERMGRMRVGCGSASMGLFAPLFLEAADEVVVLDAHITGLLSEHPAGRYVGARPSGVHLKGQRSTPGRYFVGHGPGWGGTPFVHPLEVIAGVDEAVAWEGMTLLVTETTGERAAMFRWTGRRFEEIPLTPEAEKAVEAIRSSCEPSRVSALLVGGAGGSARAGVTRYPVKLTRAVHAKKARLTLGGAPAFIYPGGGITFAVDVEQVKAGSFTWVPTPALVVPIEYTMRLDDYEAMGGHVEAMKPFEVPRWRREG